MLIGYARVSKADGSQLLDLQRDALAGAGVGEARIYEDCASGRRDHRPGLDDCLKALQPGNTLVVWKLDRLGRDLKHLVTMVDELRECGVGLRVLAGAGAEINTASSGRAPGIRHLRRPRRIRARADRRAHPGRAGRGPGQGAQGRAAAQDGSHHAADGDDRHGGARKPTPRSWRAGWGSPPRTLYAYVNGDGTVKAPGQKLLDAAAS